MTDVTADLLATNVSKTALQEKGRTLKVKLREIREALSAIQLKDNCSVTCQDIGSDLVAMVVNYDKVRRRKSGAWVFIYRIFDKHDESSSL